MKNYLYVIIVLLLINKKSNAQHSNKIDTIYVRVYQEDVRSKFHSTYENQYRIGFSFKVDWILHQIKRDAIFFIYSSPKKNGINEWSIFIKDEKEFLPYKNYFTLVQFTEKLKEQNFFLPIFQGNVQLILLLGAKCGSKVELYPVKIGTNIASEG